MTSTAAGPTRARALRTAVFALVSVVVAGLGHGAGHGASPDGAALAAAVIAATVLGAQVSKARWSAARLTGALALVQLAVHAAAWIASGAGAPVDPRLAAVAPPPVAHAHEAAPFTWRMLAAHVIAVVVAAALLAAIEHAVLTALAAAGRLRPVRRVVVPSLPPAAAVAHSFLLVLPALHLVVVRGNAPPCAVRA